MDALRAACAEVEREAAEVEADGDADAADLLRRVLLEARVEVAAAMFGGVRPCLISPLP